MLNEEKKKTKTKSVNMLVNNIGIFLKKKKNKKRQHGSESYKNLPEDEKQKLVEYRKIYYRMQKNN